MCNDHLKKEQLIAQWKHLRSLFFNKYGEDFKKFKKNHKNHYLFCSVSKHLDKSFRDINQIAEAEIREII